MTQFEKYMSSKLINERNRILDLIGTKYLRLNNLQEARNVFKTLPDTFWSSNNENYNSYLDATLSIQIFIMNIPILKPIL